MIKTKRQIIIEGRYDSFVRQVAKDVITHVKKTEGELENIVGIHLPEDINDEPFYEHESGVSFDLIVYVNRVNEPFIINGKEVKYSVNSFIDEDDSFVMEILINENYGSTIYEELFYKINEDIRHEIEHYIQLIDKIEKIDNEQKGEPEEQRRYRQRQQPEIEDTANYETTFLHHKDPSEVEALVRGFYRRAKLQKKPLDVIMQIELEREISLGDITEEEAKKLFSIWMKYAKRNLPNAKYTV